MPACPNCRHDQNEVRYDFGDHRILRCRRCVLLFLDPWPTEEETGLVYGEEYFQNPYFMQEGNNHLFGYVDYVAERLNKQPQYASIAREIHTILSPRHRQPRLLEVGCGFGYFLDVAFEEGFDVTGLEFNAHAVERLRRKYAFPILSGRLEEATLEAGSLDAGVMFDVIEHLRDPFRALDQLHNALVPNGLLVLSTVDAESLVSRIIGKRLEDFRRTREHLIFFSRSTLTRVLRDHGFEVVRLRSIGHTFDLGQFIDRLALYSRPVFGSLRTIVTWMGLASVQIYVNPYTKMIAFARRIDA